MPRPFQRDPTEFFTVVGASFVRENHGSDPVIREHRSDDRRSARLRTVFATLFSCVGGMALAGSILANSGAVCLIDAAGHAVK